MIKPSPPEPQKYPSLREVFGILLVTFSLSLLLAALWSDLENKTRLLVAEILVGVPAVAYTAWKRLDFRVTFRIRPVKWQILPVSVLIGAGIAVATEEISRLIQRVIPMDMDVLTALSDMMRAGNDRELVILILAAVVIASVVEEALFRGMLQGALERRGDVTRAVMAASLIFAFIHFNPWWVIEILLMAVLMGVLAWKTDSIFPSVALHATNNAIALVMVNLPEEKLSWLLRGDHIRPVYLILAVALIVEGFRLVYKIQDKSIVSFHSIER
ncbi:CPBP family intramembrane metalloprotease [bacterium]|nr:CPBP family intramembrane metalloprotease [bacterium]